MVVVILIVQIMVTMMMMMMTMMKMNISVVAYIDFTFEDTTAYYLLVKILLQFPKCVLCCFMKISFL